MKRYAAVLVTLIAGTAFAQEPPLRHGEFGFQPKGWEGAELTGPQQEALSDCVAAASKSTEQAAALASLYGRQPGQADFYGATLSGCLADEKDGKGWVALKRSGQAWESVTSRYALRSFMGMDPTK